jgi:hypothetical protein
MGTLFGWLVCRRVRLLCESVSCGSLGGGKDLDFGGRGDAPALGDSYAFRPSGTLHASPRCNGGFNATQQSIASQRDTSSRGVLPSLRKFSTTMLPHQASSPMSRPVGTGRQKNPLAERPLKGIGYIGNLIFLLRFMESETKCRSFRGFRTERGQLA